MGLFDKFKRNKRHYDPNNITVLDLEKGFVFEYDLDSWKVEESSSYDWGGGQFSRDYKITNGKDSHFLSVDNEDGLFLTLTNKLPIRRIQDDLPDYIERNDRPPKKILFDGVEFYLDEESAGYYKEGRPDEKGDWEEFISWDYFDQNEEKYINIEQWSERDFEAYTGKVIKAFEISNILPNE